MRKFIFILLMIGQTTQAQELMTAEQLIDRSTQPEMAIPVAMYISGWRDGVSAGLLQAAEALREVGGINAEYEAARSGCIGGLGVADLIAKLREMQGDADSGEKQEAANVVLLDGATKICEQSIDEVLARNSN